MHEYGSGEWKFIFHLKTFIMARTIVEFNLTCFVMNFNLNEF